MTNLTFQEKTGNRRSSRIIFLQFNRLYLQRRVIANAVAHLPIKVKRPDDNQYPQHQRFLHLPGASQKPAKMYPAPSRLRIDFLFGMIIPRPIPESSRRNSLKKKAHAGNRFLTYKNNQIPLKSQA
ncbi:MAG: hypothetical protein ACREOI_04965 [bacterium]